MSEIKKFVLIDFIASTVIYYALKIPSHSIVAAMVGSFAGPMLIRQTLKLNFGFSDGFRFLKRTHYSLASSRKGITSIGTWLQLRHSASKLPS
ncbi:hypothetical protein [Paenibacillus sp. NEAU-GSW1]|uniref:hypothetical protein n=1 Tax=Paenibacillus sp. NEAU-GSW1 TaxID=2682486 RepID=UPI001563FA7C|nr:hypothetical protein [Paenibacillus sp. NEAU-GSW1]